MKISETCIQRPVLAWVLTLMLVLIGLVCGGRLPLQQYPNIDRQYVTIETSLPGAGPDVVENQITRVIEEAVSGIEGVEHVHSISSVEESKVSVEFKPERSIDSALNDIRDRITKFGERLPDDATKPIFSKSRADERPIMSVALTSNTIETGDLADYAEQELRKDLESVSGVARVDLVGAGKYIMNIYLDPMKLAAYSLTVNDVINALKRQNVEQPAGKIVSKDREYLVTTIASLETPEEFNNVPVLTKRDHIVRLCDVGRAEQSAEDKKTRTLYNGKRGVSLSIVKQSNANPIDVSQSVRAFIKHMETSLPEGMQVHIGSDKTTFIQRSLNEVFKTIGEATILVVLVVFFFLRSARASFIPLITIPVSLIGVMTLMYALGFSLNIFTLMAMVLAIGLVVDDAIVVMENIYHHMERGLNAFQAAFKGVREISFSVVAMTLTLTAVYAPVALAKGMTGKLLTEFAITLAGAVILSGFVALTLSPMMCSRLLGADLKPLPFWDRFKKWLPDDAKLYKRMEDSYAHWLDVALKQRKKVVISAVGFALLGLIIHRNLPSELMPREDQGNFMIEGQAPQTATLEYTERYVKQIDEMLAALGGEVERRVTQVISPTFDISVQCAAGSRPTDEIVEQMRNQIYSTITGVEANVKAGSSSGSDDSRSVQFVIRGNKTYRELREISMLVNHMLRNSHKVFDVRSDIRGDTEDFTISILRDKVSSLSIEPRSIADMVDALMRGRKAGRFKRDNKVYDVNVEIESSARQNPYDILNLFIKTNENARDPVLVPLSELVEVNARSGPIEIHRYNRMRSVSLVAFLKPGFSVGDGVQLVNEIQKEVVPSEMRVDFVDDTKRYLTESNTMLLIFSLAVAFIYFVMAAQFESWRDPFIILLSVPLSLAGAVVTLLFTKSGSLNLYSNIGFVTLIGLITKHGILMVDCANQLRSSGQNAEQAIVMACQRRLRPILMTTFAMVLGALPLAFATGSGSESRYQLGLVIVGGMSIGTLFTLFVVPAFYTYLSPAKWKRSVIITEEAPLATSSKKKKNDA